MIDLEIKNFESWYMMQCRERTKDVVDRALKTFPWHLAPFVSWNVVEPTRLRVLAEGAEHKIVLHVALSYPDRYTIRARGWGSVQVPDVLNTHVVRYRPFKAKRWREPKVIHEAQAAYYTLRFK
jgi:hypothetical protein